MYKEIKKVLSQYRVIIGHETWVSWAITNYETDDGTAGYWVVISQYSGSGA